MLRPTSIRYISLNGAIGSVSELQAIDVNKDGYLDIVGASLYNPFQDKSVPLFTLLNDRAGSFTIDKKLTSGSTVHAREMVVADFNGDGIDDIFIADHGYDLPPFPGWKNTLLLGKVGGGFTDAPARIPKIPDFTHSADAADIDGDGDLDLFVGNINEGQSGPYFLLNNGSARFTTSTNSLPAEIADRINTFTTSLFIDIDSDGDMDLLLGGDRSSNTLLLNNGKSKFSLAGDKVPDGVFGVKNTIATDLKAFDFNQDGKLDIIAAATKANPFYQKASFQVLVSAGSGKLVDATNLYFDSQPTTSGWVKYLHFIDLNHDGALDIVGEVSGGDQALVAYLNDGNNRFYQMATGALMPYGGLTIEVADLDNDGKAELVQVGSSDGTYGVQIVSMVTTKGNVTGTAARDTVFGDGSPQKIVGGGGADFLAGGDGNDQLLGGGGADKLLGGNGNDKLAGGAARDILVGGKGADTLTGGAGADTFVFSATTDSTVAASGRDVITDFSRAQGDKIDLKTIDANTKAAGDQAFTFIGTSAFQKKAGELRYEKKSGDTFVYGDVDGDGKADFAILIDANVTLNANDFIL